MVRYSDFMANLYLVRHGNASSTWEPGDFDPGLSELGRAQAEARADQLADKGPLALVSSPLRRARDTAAALERRWKTVATVDPRIGEIQTPGVAPEHRKEWLKAILQRRWCELGEPLERWRRDVLQALLGITQDTVVFTHFVAINVAVGHAMGNDSITNFSPANCSCTHLEVRGKHIRIVELGQEQEVRIL
jgi:broad specificity phosphatase PhoE